MKAIKKADLPPEEEKYVPRVNDIIEHNGHLHLVLNAENYYLHTLSDTDVTHRNISANSREIKFVKHLDGYAPEKKYKLLYKWEGRHGRGTGELLQGAVMGGVKAGIKQFLESGQCPDNLTDFAIKEFVAFPEDGFKAP